MEKTGICRLADLLTALRRRSLDPADEEAARLCLLDGLGCMIYGAAMEEAPRFAAAVRAMSGEGNIAVPGASGRFSAENAALLGGTYAHLRELDDVHYAIVHSGSVCVPVVVSLAQKFGSSLREVLVALVVGVEAMVRVSRAMDFLDHRQRGWHGTATCGAFGAAAAAAALMDLDAEGCANAMGIAGSRTGGSWAFAADGALTKRLHPGLAARDGIVSAFFAASGIRGPHYVLEADDGGFLTMMSRSRDLSQLDAPMPELAIREVEYKWFASCKSVHSPVTAATEIFRSHPVCDPDGIADIAVEVNQSALSMAGRNYDSGSVVSAQLSIPYGVALGLAGRSGRAADYMPDVLKRPELRALADKTRVYRTDEFDEIRMKEHKSACRVTVTWKDGEKRSCKVTEPKGSFANPLSKDDILFKATELLDFALGAGRSGPVIDAFTNSPADVPFRELMPLLLPKEE